MSAKKWIILTAFLSVVFLEINAQQISRDSLIRLGGIEKQKSFLFLDNNNLDSFYFYQTKAATFFQQAADWGNFVDCISSGSYFFYKKGDFHNFEIQAFRAVEVAKEHLEEDHEAYSVALNNLSVFFNRKGDYRKSIETYQQILTLLQKSTAGNLEELATTYHNLSLVYRNMADYDEAIRYLDKILALQKELIKKDDYLIAKTYLTLGNIYRDKKDFRKAIQLYHQSLGVLSTPKNRVSAKRDILYNYQSLAKAHLELNHLDSTFFFAQKAQALHDSEDLRRQDLTYEILGDFYLKKNKPAEAIDAYLQSNQLSNRIYKKFVTHRSKARSLTRIGQVYLLDKDAENALFYFQQSLHKLAFNFTDSSFYLNPKPDHLLAKNEALDIFKGKAQAFYLRYQQRKNAEDLQAAIDNYQYATQLIQDLRQSFLAQGSKELLAEKALPIYEGGITAALALYQIRKEPQYLDQAFAFAEQNKAMLLLESLQETNAKFSGAIPAEELEQEQQLRIDIAFYEKQINQQKRKKKNVQSEKVINWQSKLFDLRQEYQQLIAHFEKKYPQYYQIKYSTQLASASSLRQQILDPHSALLEYFIGEKNSYLFCISQKDFQVWPLPIMPSLRQDISTLRQLISRAPQPENYEADCQRFAQTASRLSQQLIAPALPALPKQIQQILLVPDDILAFLPFELLLEKTAPQNPMDFYESTFAYLQNRFAISYNYSASLLQNHFSNPHSGGDKTFIGFAPSFGQEIASSSRDCNGGQLLSLQCNQQEVQEIQELFSGNSYLDKAASKATFLAEAAQYQIIHLATHACATKGDGTQNKIFFADDFLSNNDLNNLLLKAKLAVLSACNTGSGKLVKGEGVMSLSRSFILAGCPSTLMSLWAVDDCTTSNLMRSFYQQLNNGLRKDKALRQAKLQHLKSADKATAHPYYWAAFVQSGNAEAMQIQASIFSPWMLYLILGAGLLFFCFKAILPKMMSILKK